MSSPSESSSAAGRQQSREQMAGLAKGLAIIELFDGIRSRLTAAEAARATGTSRATARRCLLTLEELGYVARGEEQSFVPCARMSRLGRGYTPPASLGEAAQPLLERLRDDLEEPAALSVLEGTDVLIVARAESARIVTTGVRAGGRLPVYCSATGRVLTGEYTRDRLERLLSHVKLAPLTPKTCISVAEFVRLTERARAEGVAYCDEEIEMGMRSMAIPVHGPDGRIKYALSMSTSSARTSLSEMEQRYLPILRRHLKYFEQLIADGVF
ncbi:IclR family transcriptional regulator C-terminal domain-containing protein [Chelativorans sp. AA-79]|uniref:IclR family transcriptional regulator domain-containing protein n=1 Tax=Chelativorans sp. AA-79 TaxID=3028735 RepID=UPI0023F936FE|nr:IclR family transcriptional regulator C-terminal domain-containing protein [Chelativorans sp. AA-79]WEX09681.1 IclR family transcriptional regulator C-terminal domain-containing protein [Chelativorans sp. AA-79]